MGDLQLPGAASEHQHCWVTGFVGLPGATQGNLRLLRASRNLGTQVALGLLVATQGYLSLPGIFGLRLLWIACGYLGLLLAPRN